MTGGSPTRYHWIYFGGGMETVESKTLNVVHRLVVAEG
jgi:hypothetical protein